ncbi:hypothetical protein HPP92_025492 [Vanilla planifolia]|uniref:Uncharacterized protein n=1 Tax=Vanilla planifolia TaxID=51239 RepID=A0A835PMV3_VANPL|nr:hypothetical protein HPP92_025492 [Vanilla planifolia]
MEQVVGLRSAFGMPGPVDWVHTFTEEHSNMCLKLYVCSSLAAFRDGVIQALRECSNGEL